MKNLRDIAVEIVEAFDDQNMQDAERKSRSLLATIDTIHAVQVSEQQIADGKAIILNEQEFKERYGLSKPTELITIDRNKLRDVLIGEFSKQFFDSYDCLRVWEAWQVGTMSQDDFVPISERIENIADDLLYEIKKASS